MRFFIVFLSLALFSVSSICFSNEKVSIHCESSTNEDFFHVLTIETTQSNPEVIQNLTLTTYYEEEETSQKFTNLTAKTKDTAYSFRLSQSTILRLPNASHSTGVYTEIKSSFNASLIEIYETHRSLYSLSCTPQPDTLH